MASPVRLVLLHGSQLSGAQWTRYAALLGPDVELVVPDLPAHGMRRGEEFTWEGALRVIDEAVECGDAGVPVVLEGDGPAADAFRAIAAQLATEIAPPVNMAGCSARLLDAVEKALGPAV